MLMVWLKDISSKWFRSERIVILFTKYDRDTASFDINANLGDNIIVTLDYIKGRLEAKKRLEEIKNIIECKEYADGMS